MTRPQALDLLAHGILLLEDGEAKELVGEVWGADLLVGLRLTREEHAAVTQGLLGGIAEASARALARRKRQQRRGR